MVQHIARQDAAVITEKPQGAAGSLVDFKAAGPCLKIYTAKNQLFESEIVKQTCEYSIMSYY